jgi:hypothetical protein
MFAQRVIKGIGGITQEEATDILTSDGIRCNLCRYQGRLDPRDWRGLLTAETLLHHLNGYADTDPATQEPFCVGTPFISTTAGTVEQDRPNKINLKMGARQTAVRFATDGHSQSGFLFFGYVFTLGRRSVEMVEFSEEVRDLNIYTQYLQYHHEGEVVAKVWIPSVRLERLEECDRDGATIRTEYNPRFVRPEDFAAVREVL